MALDYFLLFGSNLDPPFPAGRLGRPPKTCREGVLRHGLWQAGHGPSGDSSRLSCSSDQSSTVHGVLREGIEVLLDRRGGRTSLDLARRAGLL